MVRTHQASRTVCFDFTVACQLSELISNKTVHLVLIQLGMSTEAFLCGGVRRNEVAIDWRMKDRL